MQWGVFRHIQMFFWQEVFGEGVMGGLSIVSCFAFCNGYGEQRHGVHLPLLRRSIFGMLGCTGSRFGDMAKPGAFDGILVNGNAGADWES